MPDAVEALATANDKKAASEAFWRLDNHIVVQSQLFEAAFWVVPILLALLAGELAEPARIEVFERLFQIVVGYADRSEVQHGNENLGELCREEVKKGLWLYYRDLVREGPAVQRVALELIAECEEDRDRLGAVLEECSGSSFATTVRAVAIETIQELSVHSKQEPHVTS